MNFNSILKNKSLQFFIIFGGILLIDALLSHCKMYHWRYITKPLILLSLIGYFMSYKKQLSRKLFLYGLVALLFSLAGDVFLMFNSKLPSFFIAGLGSFLIAHIFYTVIFIKQRNKALKFNWYQAVMLLFFAAVMGFLILPSTGGLLIPVCAYILIICLMAFSAYGRKGSMITSAYATGIIGARLFLISDSLLAISMFREGIPEVGFLVMLTYGLAQAMIVYSLVNSENKILGEKIL